MKSSSLQKGDNVEEMIKLEKHHFADTRVVIQAICINGFQNSSGKEHQKARCSPKQHPTKELY